MTASAITDIYYLLHKELHDNNAAICAIRQLLNIVRIAKVDEMSVRRAALSSWSDFEDAVQYEAAKKHRLRCIITRNKADYALSKIPVYTADELLELFVS